MNAAIDVEPLAKLIRKKSPKACLAFLKKLTADERRSLSKPVLKIYREANKAWRDSYGSSDKPLFGKSPSDVLENAQVCVFGTASLSEIKNLPWHSTPGNGFVMDIVEALKPQWIDEWAEYIVDEQPRMYVEVRLLYSAGLCKKPSSDGYILGMIDAVPGWVNKGVELWGKHSSLVERIRSIPDIREEDVWRLFEVEGGGEHSLAAFDKYIGEHKVVGWTQALIELSAEGTLSRDRLLDASLDALDRDFAQFRAGWFSRFHELLEPTLEEREKRCGRYLHLLGSSIAPTVSFALKAVVLLDKHKKLTSQQLLDHLGPVLHARAKGTVFKGLRLLANVAKREPKLSSEISLQVVEALIHEAGDVQEKALKLLDGLNPQPESEIVSAIGAYTDSLAPSLVKRFSTLVGEAPEPEESDEAREAIAVGEIIPVIPIQSFDELNMALLKVIEDPSDPLEVERVLNGLAMYGNDKPKDFDKLIGPLGKRALAIVKRQSDDELRDQLVCLASAYSSNDNQDFKDYCAGDGRYSRPFPSHFAQVFKQRGVELLKQLTEEFQPPLLSAPTDSRGFVAAKELVARYATYKLHNLVPGKMDFTLALMRLAPDNRGDVLKSLAMDDEYEQSIGYALGAEVSVGQIGWLWVAAAASRKPYENQPAIAKTHGFGLPEAGVRARYTNKVERRSKYWVSFSITSEPEFDGVPPEAYLASLFHTGSTSFSSFTDIFGVHVNMVRWCSTVWPLHLEPYFYLGGTHFNNYEQVANTPYVAFFEAMLPSHVELGDTGTVLLTIGLAATDVAVRSIALDVAITVIEEDRINLENFQQSLALLLPSEFAPVARWSKPFKEIAAVSARHMNFVRDLIGGSLRHDPADAPRGIATLVEVLYEYSVALDKPVTDRETLAYLKGVKGSGKLKQFARKLLAMS